MKRYTVLTLLLMGLTFITLFVLFSGKEDLSFKNEIVQKEKKIELRFSSSWSGIDNKTDILEEIIQEFESTYNYIDIIDESIFGEDFLFTLKADFASGNGPDVFGLWPGSDLEILIEKDFIADLSSVLAENPEWFDSFDPRVFEFLNQDDGIYSIPFEIIYEGLFLNLDLFEAYNISVPEDYDDFISVVKTFRNNGIVPIAYNLTPEGSFIYQNLVVALGGKYATENPITATGEIESNYIDAMYRLKELYELGAFPKNAFTLDDVSRNKLFIDKKAAMIVQGSWFNSESLGENIGLIPFPVNKSKNSIVYGIGNGNFHISQDTFEDVEKKEAAVLFLQYLTSAKSRDKFSSLSGFITSDIMYSDDHLKNIGYELIANADELVGPPDHYINRNWWESVLIGKFPNMLEGDITPEEIFEMIEEIQ